MYKLLPILLFVYGLAITTEDIYDNSYALIIGIDKYENVRSLDYAVKDAEDIQSMLVDKFHFQQNNIVLLKDEEATKTSIIQEFSNITKKAGDNDRVLIFFAGHGETQDLPDGGEMGYLLPVDGNKTDLYVSAIEMDELKTLSLLSEAKHILYLIDACYGGIASIGARGLDTKSTPDYLKKITQYKSRQIISAGGRGEQVIEKPEWGHSAFTKNLLSGLRDSKADTDSDGIITAQELGTYLKKKVTIDSNDQQTPKTRNLTSDEGEFVFFSSWKNNVVETSYKTSQERIPIPSSVGPINKNKGLESLSYVLDITDINIISGMGQLGLVIDEGKKEIYMDFGSGIGRKIGTEETFMISTVGLIQRQFFSEFGTIFFEYGLHGEFYMYKYKNQMAQIAIVPNSEGIGIKPLIGLGFYSPLKIFNKRLPIIKSFTFGYRFVPQELEQVGITSGPVAAMRLGYFTRKYQENYAPNK